MQRPTSATWDWEYTTAGKKISNKPFCFHKLTYTYSVKHTQYIFPTEMRSTGNESRNKVTGDRTGSDHSGMASSNAPMHVADGVSLISLCWSIESACVSTGREREAWKRKEKAWNSRRGDDEVTVSSMGRKLARGWPRGSSAVTTEGLRR
jgi:hypothetical protein